MGAERERRRPGRANPGRDGSTLAPPAPAPAHAGVLELQRNAGNAAVAGLLQRKSHIAPPRAGGWNEAPQEVAGTFRIPVAGVTAGNQLVDEQADQTTESAAGRAVVIIPKGLDLGKKVDTLLFFHGMFNAGDRERTTADKHRGKAGTVHDVEVDRIPQQIASNGGNVVAVLPQGTNLARFGIADPDAYVKEVLKLATPEYQKQPQAQQLSGPIEPGKVIVSGHSGGGRAAFAAVQKLESKGSVNAWLASPPLMLFDAINGTAELDAVASWVEGWLDTDLAMLSAVTPPKTPADLLKQRRLKLLSTFTAGSRYEALNAKGSYVDDKGATITITTAQGLRGRIEKWFTTHHVDPAYATELRAQYVVDGPVGGVHEQTVGTGSSPEMEGKPRVAAPGGLTGASKAAGVPGYSGGGRLEKGLAKLYPKRAALARAPGDDAAQLEADWNDPAYASSQDKFAGGGRPAGGTKERYLKLAPLYKAHGIDRPLKWAHENITSVTFFGSTTPAHVALKTALEAAEADLRKQGLTKKPFTSCWAFNPRTTSAGGWSNHADGKAVDIDADTNPHLIDQRQKKVINALTGMDVTAANPGAELGLGAYDAIVEMSKRFDERFTPEGIERRIAELEAEEQRFAAEETAIKGEIGALPKAKRGRLTPEKRKTAADVAQKKKELTRALAAKHAQVAKAHERQGVLGREQERFDKLDTEAEVQRWKIADLENEIYDIEKDIDAREAQIEADEATLDAKDDKTLRAKVRKDRRAVAALDKSRRAKQAAIGQADEKIDPLHRWGKEGFMDLQPQLVTALKQAGLSWGGEWKGSKDFMHFEVP